MNYFYLLWRILFLLIAYFLPDIVKPIYCYIKRKTNNTYKCSYWNCKKYPTCFYNEKTLLDFKSSKKHLDPLFYFTSIPFIIIFTIVFTYIEVLIWQ